MSLWKWWGILDNQIKTPKPISDMHALILVLTLFFLGGDHKGDHNRDWVTEAAQWGDHSLSNTH